MTDDERERVEAIPNATMEMVEDYRALVRWYAAHRTPHVDQAFVNALVAAIGEISVDDAVAALKQEESRR